MLIGSGLVTDKSLAKDQEVWQSDPPFITLGVLKLRWKH